MQLFSFCVFSWHLNRVFHEKNHTISHNFDNVTYDVFFDMTELWLMHVFNFWSRTFSSVFSSNSCCFSCFSFMTSPCVFENDSSRLKDINRGNCLMLEQENDPISRMFLLFIKSSQWKFTGFLLLLLLFFRSLTFSSSETGIENEQEEGEEEEEE